MNEIYETAEISIKVMPESKMSSRIIGTQASIASALMLAAVRYPVFGEAIKNVVRVMDTNPLAVKIAKKVVQDEQL